EVGLAQASTPMICTRAGVSRGALTHHYPSRAELVAAAIEHATATALQGLDQALSSSAPGRQAVASFCGAIWRTTEGPLFAVALEFLVAARHDPALWPALQQGREALERQVAERLADV
ncbi:TetR/AcrR family transcriptional regulator, partial [Stenotrophomonas sp. A3_2]|uniref:TetR/AcrR family transcriptional regulator n=1 Tax=Stenotrophomonas sp. A3_2 TaxID=3119978 RepID=UPI002FC2FF91